MARSSAQAGARAGFVRGAMRGRLCPVHVQDLGLQRFGGQVSLKRILKLAVAVAGITL